MLLSSVNYRCNVNHFSEIVGFDSSLSMFNVKREELTERCCNQVENTAATLYNKNSW